MSKNLASSGHKIGQLIGDWFEEELATYLLSRVAKDLNLYLDHRFKNRKCRQGKIIWKALDGSEVDYDFVLELGGTDDEKGIPLAFFETFWRRRAGHSRDKARDDSGKLLPMGETYPTARILGILAAGDFTAPAQEFIKGRGIDLFYIPKTFIYASWAKAGIPMEHGEKASEEEKSKIAEFAVSKINKASKKVIFDNLISTIGQSVFNSYIDKIKAGIAAIPIEYKITSIFVGKTVAFTEFQDVVDYIKNSAVYKDKDIAEQLYRYEAVFSDGKIFERLDLTTDEALLLHSSVGKVSDFFDKYHKIVKA
ncbi:hypothetical protein HII17_13405 [Thalassotalea sp. M1531]|uniref:Uncharacterized protein n=1 Tax=Thalassotalea algicola TaxID=2716224 RepID=A0A7Y0LE16_9GAMM|nr:hypothetical protein [Thalassotalea algicola]NMP32557.1 hypothetical protein [Thalassotalea algicola]